MDPGLLSPSAWLSANTPPLWCVYSTNGWPNYCVSSTVLDTWDTGHLEHRTDEQVFCSSVQSAPSAGPQHILDIFEGHKTHPEHLIGFLEAILKL